MLYCISGNFPFHGLHVISTNRYRYRTCNSGACFKRGLASCHAHVEMFAFDLTLTVIALDTNSSM